MQTATHIDFESLFRDITALFTRNPSLFFANIRKSHHLPQGLPENWPDLDIQTKTNHFLAHFRFVFAFDELEVFVKQANMQPDSFPRHFGADTHALFASICYLYQTLLYSLHGTPAFAKAAPTLVFSFAKLLIPAGNRHVESSSFHLEFVYISPVLFSCGVASKRPVFCIVHESGLIHIVDAGSSDLIMKIDQERLTGINQGDRLFFYDEDMEPKIEL